MLSMEAVALHLQQEAVKRDEDTGRDLFGRSAYNRYYYATYLTVRALISMLNAQWKNLPHSDYPSLLEGKLLEEIKRGKKRAQKLSDGQTIQICQQAQHAAHCLADVMKKGNAARVIADYHPDVAVNFISGGRFALNGVDISDAHQWPSRASAWSDSIKMAWQQINAD